MSALLRGLEEQALIERSLDPKDRRGFCIRLSETGRALIRQNAPAHVAYLNRLVVDLDAEHQAQLIELLARRGAYYRLYMSQFRPQEAEANGGDGRRREPIPQLAAGQATA